MRRALWAPLATLFLFLAASATPVSLEQIKAEGNPEHRAKDAIDYCVIAEKNAETAYSKGDMKSTAVELKNVEASVETANEALVATGKKALHHPGPYKYAEMHSREILVRMGDLKQRMEVEERAVIEAVIEKVQEIHDNWFDGIMGEKK